MTKTPEQLAEEFAKGMAQRDISMRGTSHREESCLRIGYLAGYQAAKEQFANADKVKPRQDGDLLHQVANNYLDMKAAKYRRVCGYKK